MKKIDGLTLHVQDLLRSWRAVQARRMFGGIGLFVDGLMFAIIIDEVLYLKETLDEHGKPVQTSEHYDEDDFVKEYFEYETKNGVGRIYYFRVPESALDNPDYLTRLSSLSLKSAQAQALKKSQKSKKGRK
ncbi:MAG: TfoX/Sxy family protein [Cyanobacteria bacterium TGS_CYA1]|nr:TfoX/Sxy family protein [Cyanobacteria bacterium TGS_CYA1]